jgi:hypothetical protein
MISLHRLLIAALLLLPLSAQAQGLFVAAPAAPAAALSTPSALPGTVKRSRVMAVDGAYLGARVAGDAARALGAGAQVMLPLFPDVEIRATGRAGEPDRDGRSIWSGRPEGDAAGLAILVVKDGQVTGQVQTGDRIVEIRPLGGGLHRITEIDQSAFPAERDAVPPARAAAPPAGTGTPSADSDTTITLLVAYTSRTAAASSDIVSEIALAVASANTVYENSGIPLRLSLVGTALMSGYDETTRTYDQLLNDLTETGDGRMDSVHTLRSAYQADMVALITERTEYCGLAWLYDGSPAYAFSVTTRSCATSNLTLVHELGHNMGANHDRSVEGGGDTGSYAYGYVDLTARIRTVMAYDTQCGSAGFSCTRVPYFSSPYLTYGGRPLGVEPWSTNSAYNVRKLTENRSAISNFRSGTDAPVTPASGWWWNASEGGRGYSIEIANGKLFFAAYSYAADGSAVWYVSSGAMTGTASYSGPLIQYGGGQTLSGAYRAPTTQATIGTMTLTFYAADYGYLSFPDGGGTIIRRFDFITNGAVGGTAPGYPETGWWWNASEGGRGFFFEAQNTSMYVSFYLYNEAGQAVWYVANGTMVSSSLFSGTLTEYSGGSMLASGSFRAPTASISRGAVTIQFPTATTGVMTLPSGAQVALTRFAF